MAIRRNAMRKRKKWGGVATGASLAIVAAVSAIATAQDFSMTGDYQGVYVCDSTTAGIPTTWSRPMRAGIVQNGTSIQIDLGYTDEQELGNEYSLYSGEIALSSDGSLLSGYFAACGGTFPSLELARIFPTATSPAPFSFTSDSIWVSDQVPNIPGLTVQSCKWTLARTSTDAPTVRPCTSPPG
ncbi:MAG: hypothetical protein AAF414_13045 [Pseudomonadota bacterium]